MEGSSSSASSDVLNDSQSSHCSETNSEPEVVTLSSVSRVLDIQSYKALSASCTFTRGYATQLAFWCRDCYPLSSSQTDVNGPLAVCEGCYHICHGNHNVEKLWSKRGFRCSCPVPKANKLANAQRILHQEPIEAQCCTFAREAAAAHRSSATLSEPTDEDVALNTYSSQSWHGIYCYCAQPYDESAGVMFQCILCQDWFHDKCVQSDPSDDSDGFLCRNCVNDSKFDFLAPYLVNYFARTNLATKSVPTTDQVESKQMAPSDSPSAPEPQAQVKEESAKRTSEDDLASDKKKAKVSTDDTSVSTSTSATSSSSSSSTTSSTSSEPCIRPLVCTHTSPLPHVFVPMDILSTLCKCTNCIHLYQGRGLNYIYEPPIEIEQGDPAESDDDYDEEVDESKVQARSAFLQQQELKVLSSLPPTTAVETVLGLSTFRDLLKQKLNEIASSNPNAIVDSEMIKSITRQATEEAREILRTQRGSSNVLPE